MLREFEDNTGVLSVREGGASREYLIRRSVCWCENKDPERQRWGDAVRTSMTTMAREYMSDSFVTLITEGAGSELASNMESRSGAIHLMDPALFTVEACADSASAVMDASPKSHSTALLLSLMRMLGCA
jgi:hypothetical protein